MADEINPHSAGPRIVRVSIQAERPEMPFEFPLQQRRRLAATGVAGALRAHEDEVFVGAGAGLEGGGGGGDVVGLALRGGLRVGQGGGCCGGWGDMGGYEVRDCGGCDVVDKGEGREEEDGCGAVFWWGRIVEGGKGEVGG